MPSIDDAIAKLPADSPYREMLVGIWSSDKELRNRAEDVLNEQRRPYWEKQVAIDEAIARVVLDAVLDIPAPPPAKYRPGVGDVAFSLIGSITLALLDLIRAGYARAADDTRLSLLTLVASVGTLEGATLFADLVRDHGWPKQTYQRLFSELSKNMPHANVLFPSILEAAGAPALEVGDLLIRALRTKSLDPARVAETEIARSLPARIDELIGHPHKLAMRLDLAGFLGESAEIVPRLRKALTLPATWPGIFAIVSLFRRGEEVDDESLARVAGDPATRAPLYALLADIGRSERIPASMRTRDAFAEADMVQWLSHPGELGHPPVAIEKMATFEARRGEDDVTLYVWRFRGEEDGVWKASVSGPYLANLPEGPLSGSSTFSRFDPWDEGTAEEHAGAVLDTLADWAREHAKR